MLIDGRLDDFFKWQDTKSQAVASTVFAEIKRYVDSGRDIEDPDVLTELRGPILSLRQSMRGCGYSLPVAKTFFDEIPESKDTIYNTVIRFVIEKAYNGVF